MSRLFLFSTILMGVVIAHIVCPKPPSEMDISDSGKSSSIVSIEKCPDRLPKTTTKNPSKPITTKKPSASNANTRRTRRTRSAGSSDKRKHSPAVTKTNSNKQPGPKSSKKLDTDDTRWILENFDKTKFTDNFSGDREWEKAGDYKVYLRNGIGSRSLRWKKEREHAVVELDAYNNGDIKQKWSFEAGQVIVTININANTHFQTEVWTFPQSMYQFLKRDDGKDLDKKWLRSGDFKWQGPEDFQSLRKYEKYIKGWCLHNEFFIGQGKCFVTKVSTISNA